MLVEWVKLFFLCSKISVVTLGSTCRYLLRARWHFSLGIKRPIVAALTHLLRTLKIYGVLPPIPSSPFTMTRCMKLSYDFTLSVTGCVTFEARLLLYAPCTLNISERCISPTSCIYVSCDSYNSAQLLPYTALTEYSL